MTPDRAELLRALAYSILVESAEIALFWVAGLLSLESTSARRDERDRAASRSDTAAEMSTTRANEGRGHSGVGADGLQATPDATPDQTAAVSRATDKEPASHPSMDRQAESCAV